MYSNVVYVGCGREHWEKKLITYTIYGTIFDKSTHKIEVTVKAAQNKYLILFFFNKRNTRDYSTLPEK